MLFLEIGGSSVQRVYFRGGFQVALKPGDRAVYIGTVRYHRDEFFEVTRVTVADDYREASAEFRHPVRRRRGAAQSPHDTAEQQEAANALLEKTLVP